jgi:hypothetical protein
MFTAIANIIFAYPQPVRRVTPGVFIPQVGNHWVNITKRTNAMQWFTALVEIIHATLQLIV